MDHPTADNRPVKDHRDRVLVPYSIASPHDEIEWLIFLKPEVSVQDFMSQYEFTESNIVSYIYCGFSARIDDERLEKIRANPDVRMVCENKRHIVSRC
ncbi:hypothetical protein CPB83DRAFT_851925 [Crepidotus variabilis]|uniref:Inhibitor I9 domain-containing protein n=1 Tax=Crepidotus variabilis TaxID=179855 RepID=A0A9P6EJV1_9AGAR|nr:hypothetical protein CPB83DRAFT_851925 [Crepidotus variabilis]